MKRQKSGLRSRSAISGVVELRIEAVPWRESV